MLNAQQAELRTKNNEQHEQIQLQKAEIQELNINLDAAKKAIMGQKELKAKELEALREPILVRS